MCRTQKSLTLSVLVLSVLFVSFTPTPGYAKKKKRGSKGPSLPALTEAPPSDLDDAGPLHAIYSSDQFTAAINTQGKLLVLPKTTSKSSGQIKPLLVQFACYRKLNADDPRAKPRRMKVTVFPNPPAPAINPKEVTIQSEHVGGTQVSITYTFSEDEVTAEGVYKDPPKLDPSSRMEYMARIPSSHTFPSGTTPDQVKKAVKGFTISAGKKTVPYTAMGGLGRGIESASIVKQWPGRTVEVSLEEAGRLVHYKTMPLYKGYNLEGLTAAKSSGKGKITVSVE